MDPTRVALLRAALSSTDWVDRSRSFARSLRTSTRTPGGLLLLGTPDDEPWHLAAHLSDESRRRGIPEIAPVLLRWSPPAGAPPHLSIGLDRISATGRGETLFVVASTNASAAMLERISDARRAGATILALDVGDRELESLAHDALIVPAAHPSRPDGISLDVVQHLVSAAAGEPMATARMGLRRRLTRGPTTRSGPGPTPE